jgi:CBS domain containing-hemolysin-like protein
VPQYQAVRELFELLVKEHLHIAMVVDEYGGVTGLVSMEDVVETLLGLEIMDESDVEQDMRAVAREQWLKRARRMGFVDGDE